MKLGPELWDVSQDFGPPGLGASGHRPPGFGRRAGARAGALLALVLSLGTGCGYRPVYGATTTTSYFVATGRYSTASFEAVQAMVGGVRSELGAAEALGGTYPQVVVELLRVDERSIGVRSTSNDVPLARGSEIIVVGRATVVPAPEAAPSFDTGDVSRSAQFAAGVSPTADAAARSRAARDAARKVGQALGRAVLGLPEPSEG